MLKFITPASYWVLTVLWLVILGLYLFKLRHSKVGGGAVSVLLTLLAVDAFRTLFESIYFGLYFNSMFGLLPNWIYEALSQPAAIIVPKLVNIFAGILVITLLIRRWIPHEIQEREEWIATLQETQSELQKSEARFKDIAMSMGDLIWEINDRGVYSYCSENVTDILGYSVEEIVNKSPYDFMESEQSETVKAFIKDQIADKATFRDFESWSLHKNGKLVCFLTSGTPIVSADGSLVGYRGVHKDVTKSKKSELELVQRRAEFEVIFDSITDAIVFVDTHRQITRVNPAFTKILGYRLDEVYGKTTQLIYADPDDYFKQGQKRFNKEGTNDQPLFENKYRRKDGSIFIGDTLGIHIVDGNGELLGFLGVIRDITVRKKLLEEHGRSAQLAALGTLAAGVAHEINNPIQGVLNYATLIQKAPQDHARVAEISKRIIRESLRIATITKDLLFYARDSKFDLVPSNVHDLVKSALSLLKVKLHQQEIVINMEFPEDLPELMAYPQGIQQIVINLVDNANDALRLKDVSPGKKEILVKGCLVSQESEPSFCLEVFDSGKGMSESVLTQAKEAFFSTKRSAEGTGLGLSIVNEIVNKHGGHFDIESAEGEYTRVRVFLPFKTPSEVTPCRDENKQLEFIL